MNFFYEDSKLDKIIKKYNREDNVYTITYIDGSISRYISYNENEEESIKQKMIEQAKLRDKLYDMKPIQTVSTVNLVALFVSAIGYSVADMSDVDLLKIVSLIFLGMNLSDVISNSQKVKELKKYKMFLELIDNVGEKELNSPKYTKCYEFDNLYAKPININTVDEFSLSDIKSMYKLYKK